MSLYAELKRRNVIRVAITYIVLAWLVLQVGDTLAPILRLPDSINSALLFFLVLGFFPAIVFAWAFELTPEGLRREKDVDREESITSETGRKLDVITIVAVVVGIAFVAWSRSGDDVEPEITPAVTQVEPATDSSVAVLPFVNMSNNPENEYFSDGLTETLLHMLAQVPELQVAARTSSFAFKDEQDDIRKIAEALGVAHVLEGSVQRAGDRVRITAQLIRASDGFHVWSENYDRTLDDIFRIQDEIANEVGGALSRSLLGESENVAIDGVGTDDLTAYDHYLHALANVAVGSYDSLREAEDQLRDAILKDPDFLDAKTRLARVYVMQAQTGIIDWPTANRNALSLSEQVLDVRPIDVSASAIRAHASSELAFLDGDSEARLNGLAEIRKIAARSPSNVMVRRMLAGRLSGTGKNAEAIEELTKLLDYDRLNPGLHYQIAVANFEMENFDAAKKAISRSLELEPDQPNGHNAFAEIALRQGDGLSAIKHWITAMRLDREDPELAGGVAELLYEIGLAENADRFLKRALSISPSAPLTRKAQLMQAIAAGDDAKAVAIARGIVSDRIANRYETVSEAVRTITRSAVRNDTVDEAIEFLESAYPGFSDWQEDSVHIRVRGARINALPIWKGRVDQVEMNQRMEKSYAFLQLFDAEIADSPIRNIKVLALGDKPDEAIDVALSEFFPGPPKLETGWRRFFAQPFLAEVVADARVQQEMQRWAAEEAAMAEEIQGYLASLDDETAL